MNAACVCSGSLLGPDGGFGGGRVQDGAGVCLPSTQMWRWRLGPRRAPRRPLPPLRHPAVRPHRHRDCCSFAAHAAAPPWAGVHTEAQRDEDAHVHSGLLLCETPVTLSAEERLICEECLQVILHGGNTCLNQLHSEKNLLYFRVKWSKVNIRRIILFNVHENCWFTGACLANVTSGLKCWRLWFIQFNKTIKFNDLLSF